MAYAATVVKVLIASPRDTSEMRDAVELALHEWNGDRSPQARVVLLPRRWETNAVPQVTGSDGQTVINAQLVADADIVFGIFHTMLGTETPRAASGTAEELGHSSDAGKPVHVYFSAMPIPRDHDRTALQALDEFKNQMSQRGLYGSFDTITSLKEQVKRAIEHDLASLDLDTQPSGHASASASLRASFAHDRESDSRGRTRSRRQRIEITNDGDAVARDITYEIHPLGDPDDQAPMIHHDGEPFTIAPYGGRFSIPILRYAGSSNNVQLVLRWTEDDKERHSEQTVSLY